MKKLTVICVLAVVMAAICGCGGNDMFKKVTPSNETIANNQMEAFLNALESHDTERLMSLFAPNALSEAEDFQQSIDSLFSYYQGNYSSYDNWSATGASTRRENSHVVKKLYGTYDVTTDANVYRFAFLYVATDSHVPDNVGLWSVYIIKMDDDLDPQYAYRGDDMYTPGIQIGIQNTIPAEFEPSETEEYPEI